MVLYMVFGICIRVCELAFHDRHFEAVWICGLAFRRPRSTNFGITTTIHDHDPQILDARSPIHDHDPQILEARPRSTTTIHNLWKHDHDRRPRPKHARRTTTIHDHDPNMHGARPRSTTTIQTYTIDHHSHNYSGCHVLVVTLDVMVVWLLWMS